MRMAIRVNLNPFVILIIYVYNEINYPVISLNFVSFCLLYLHCQVMPCFGIWTALWIILCTRKLRIRIEPHGGYFLMP